MTTHKLKIASMFLLVCAACVTPDDSISKDDARSMPLDQWDEDYCASQGWYGDAVCDTFCPEDDEDCSDDSLECGVDDCEVLPAIAQLCPDGTSVGASCGMTEDGVCGAVFVCPEPEECECDSLPAIAQECEDGTYVGATCGRVEDGTCGAVFDCPGPVDPDECVCETLPAIAKVCEDGTHVGATCGRLDDGECGAVFLCE